MSLRDEAVSGLAEQILRQFKSDVGVLWRDRLTAEDRGLIESASLDAAAFLVSNLAGLHGNATREKAHIDAQLLNVRSIAAAEASRRLWAAAGAALKTTLAVVLN